MNKFATLGLALLAATAVAAPSLADDDDDDRARRHGPAETWIGTDQVMQKLKEHGYSGFTEIERDDGRYEVDATGPDGRRMDLKVNRRTGEIVRAERDDDDDDNDRYDD